MIPMYYKYCKRLSLLFYLYFFRNLELAFSVAEKQLGIASLLDPEDLLSTPSPDRFSVLTYLSQFYHTFCQV